MRPQREKNIKQKKKIVTIMAVIFFLVERIRKIAYAWIKKMCVHTTAFFKLKTWMMKIQRNHLRQLNIMTGWVKWSEVKWNVECECRIAYVYRFSLLKFIIFIHPMIIAHNNDNNKMIFCISSVIHSLTCIYCPLSIVHRPFGSHELWIKVYLKSHKFDIKWKEKIVSTLYSGI